ncbi:MAG: GNAT family N-acetyltransferase [Actinobacteria bacterium]|nr:MAG: GNAT family N-acetyltransferase [Actinomycetota bacterium]
MIELVAGTVDTSAAARIRTMVWRWSVIEPEAIEHSRATTPQFHDWLALLDGEPVGAGSCSLNPGMEEDTAAFAVACVLPHARGQGVGTAIYRQVSAHARGLGKSQLMTWGYEDDAGGVAFAELHGFAVVKRNRGLRLVLDGCPRPTVDLPEDIAITTLADSPELARGVWETASEAMPDIPHYAVPMSAGSLEEFAGRSFAGPKHIPEATFIAVRDGEVVGYAQLAWMSRAAGIADHAMLAVRRAWRGRGIAKALKARQITWALDNGLSELRTGNDERNASARAVNANFAYTPLPEQLGYRGPLLVGE